MTRCLLVLVAALAAAPIAAPVALGDGPMGNAQQNGDGILAADRASRIVAIGIAGDDKTMLTKISTRTGSVEYAVPLLGSWGIPTVAAGRAEGIAADGKTLVLGEAAVTYPRARSGFLLVDPRSFRVRAGITLKGDFLYDSISPDGTRLYLIQHTSSGDLSRYVVRAFAVPSLRLLPGRVADRTQKNWVMQGYPVDRTATADGRWVYTLYANPGGFPFVHALDTVRGVAHCVGLPWRGSESAPYNLRLSLHGTSLHVGWMSGRRWERVDTRTWSVTADARPFAWWVLAVAFAALMLALIGWRYHRQRDGRRTGAFTPRTA